MKVSILPKDNPSYSLDTTSDGNESNDAELNVFDVLLAGVEAND